MAKGNRRGQGATAMAERLVPRNQTATVGAVAERGALGRSAIYVKTIVG